MLASAPVTRASAPRATTPDMSARARSDDVASRAGGALPSLAPASQPVIQRAIATPNNENVPHALRETIAAQLAAHNNDENRDSNEQGHLHAQFTRLDRLQRTVQSHLRDHPDAANDEQRTELFGLLRRTQEEHATLTGRLLDSGGEAWVHPDQAEHAGQIRETWNSIRDGTGGIRFRAGTPDAYRHQTMSGFAQLLQQPHGRQLVRDLNTPAEEGHRVVIHAPALGEASAAVPFDNGQAHANGPDAMLGSGSDVTVSTPSSATPVDLDRAAMDDGERPIFSPAFLSLGHELGHARAFRAGRGAGQVFDNTVPQADQTSWTRMEEYRNITQDENALRDEHDMPRRRFHAGRAAHRAHQTRAALTTEFDAIADSHLGEGGRHSRGAQIVLADAQRRLTHLDTADADAVAGFRAHMQGLVGDRGREQFTAAQTQEEREDAERERARAARAQAQRPGLMRRAWNYMRQNPGRTAVGGTLLAGGLTALGIFLRNRLRGG